ncbi:hypothetical protein B0H67DRAFT_649206 [Lasiosphaeris hirsuta]|uniref:Uncharacterized protein n=1 Tax=Lasiosphaeris hirsuta TaxID=260670 RepID=A0AA40DIV5_9PEZI|nr:hypothetical protein B0H67DRAFT_649206 [Lasiosphaeris hirsuta]
MSSPNSAASRSPSPEDQPDDAAAMATMLGFSTFGMRDADRPAKKRRFHAHADDAVVAGLPSNQHLPRKPPAPISSGVNRLPLHPREPAVVSAPRDGVKGKGKGAGGNADEIDLDDDDDVDEGGSVAVQPQGLQAASALPAPAGPVLGSEFESARGGRGGLGRGGRGGGGRGGFGHDPTRQWWIDYYDPSSNENPWDRLEQARGLEPVGTWLAGRPSGGRGGRVITG